MEKTLIILKPDSVQRGLVGPILTRLERRGLKIVALKMMRIDETLARRHYAEHEGQPYYPGLISFVTSAPVVVVALEGQNVIEITRAAIGATNPAKAAPGTIRADYGIETRRNLVHASDSPESARREIALFFREDEFMVYRRDVEQWISA
jgi:nucleoside-diphosphate kinase